MTLLSNGYTDVNAQQPFHEDTQNKKISPSLHEWKGSGKSTTEKLNDEIRRYTKA